MADVVEAIINHYETSTDTAAGPLRLLLEGDSLPVASGTGKLFCDYDPDTTTQPPYVAVSDQLGSKLLSESFGHTARIDETTIQFTVVASRRGEVVEILAAIENAFLESQLTTTDWVAIGQPQFDLRKTFWGLEHWQGLIEMTVTTEKTTE